MRMPKRDAQCSGARVRCNGQVSRCGGGHVVAAHIGARGPLGRVGESIPVAAGPPLIIKSARLGTATGGGSNRADVCTARAAPLQCGGSRRRPSPASARERTCTQSQPTVLIVQRGRRIRDSQRLKCCCFLSLAPLHRGGGGCDEAEQLCKGGFYGGGRGGGGTLGALGNGTSRHVQVAHKLDIVQSG